MSKGSNARPFAVDRDTFASNFDAIFGKKKPMPEIHPAQTMGAWGKPQEALSAPAYGLDEGKSKAR